MDICSKSKKSSNPKNVPIKSDVEHIHECSNQTGPEEQELDSEVKKNECSETHHFNNKEYVIPTCESIDSKNKPLVEKIIKPTLSESELSPNCNTPSQTSPIHSVEEKNRNDELLNEERECHQPSQQLNENKSNEHLANLDNIVTREPVLLNNEINNIICDTSTLSNHTSLMSNSSLTKNLSHDEVLQLSTKYSPLDNSCINPNPNDFSLLENNDLSCSSFVQTKNTDNHYLSHSDNSVVISNNALPQTEHIASSNYSLAQLKAYGSDDDDSLGDNILESKELYRNVNDIQESDKDSDSESSSTSSSSSILISDSSETESDENYDDILTIPKPIKAKGELTLTDLPPIEDLKISVSEDDCVLIGKIFQIVNELVVVEALKDNPAYDLDTVLFLRGGQPLGQVFDVFGPVTAPYYCVRFNSREQIAEKKISLNQEVFSAPKTKHTNYVFLAQLMKVKGSDASWENDVEPPEIHLDYSDDEQEQRAKKDARKKVVALKGNADPDEPARKKHFAYEKRMNQRNSQLSGAKHLSPHARNKPQHCSTYKDPWTPRPGSFEPSVTRPSPMPNFCHKMFGRPPTFESRVPPPNTFSPGVSMSHVYRPVHSTGNHFGTPPGYINSDQSPYFPQRPQIPPSISNNSNIQSVPNRFRFNQVPNNTATGWSQPYPTPESSCLRLPPPLPPPRDNSFINNNYLPTSRFQTPRPDFILPRGQTPFQGFQNTQQLSHRMFYPNERRPSSSTSSEAGRGFDEFSFLRNHFNT